MTMTIRHTNTLYKFTFYSISIHGFPLLDYPL